MNKFAFPLRRSRISSILILIPILIYGSLLWAVPLIPIASSLVRYSYVLFLGVLSLFLISFFIKGKAGILIGLTITLGLCALTLLNKWSSGFSDNMLIGGLLPYKDAQTYYLGAHMILDGSPIAQTSLQAAGRPLFPGFLALFMLLTQSNLQWALALIFACAGICVYLSARWVFLDRGVWAGALLATFLFLYIRPLIGFALSESAGFIFGSLAFIILWNAAQNMNKTELLIGLVVLTLAISIRTGAFFMLPMLILWAGWVFRGEKRFSLPIAFASTITVAAAFILMNVVYPRMTVEPGSVTFGNFAYAFYGQVHGGTGWHYAIEVMGTRDPGPIMQAAIQFFLKHPFSFLIGAAKAYRDFFFTNSGLFEYRMDANGSIFDTLLWFVQLLLLAIGLVRTVKRISYPPYSLLLAGFVGVFLSIPFLPPIDGGSRFYASSVTFLFALVAMAVATNPEQGTGLSSDTQNASSTSIVALVVVLCVVSFPVLLQRVNHQPIVPEIPVCQDDFEPFIARVYQGSFIDLIRLGNCGLAPQICLADFIENGTEPTTDDFYQELITQANAYDHAMRATLVTNLYNGKYYYLIGTPEQIEPSPTGRLITGCAAFIRTRNQNIYRIQTVLFP